MLPAAQLRAPWRFLLASSRLLWRLVPWRRGGYRTALRGKDTITAFAAVSDAVVWGRPERGVPEAGSKSTGSMIRPPGVTLPSSFGSAGIMEGGSLTTKQKGDSSQDPLVQYVVVRKDLQAELGWTTGAVVAQACHACVSVVGSGYSAPEVQAYLAEGESMRKVVLEVNSEDELRSLSETLQKKGVLHKLWVEQPEETATCLAVQPLPKSQVQPYLKKLKLFS